MRLMLRLNTGSLGNWDKSTEKASKKNWRLSLLKFCRSIKALSWHVRIKPIAVAKAITLSIAKSLDITKISEVQIRVILL